MVPLILGALLSYAADRDAEKRRERLMNAMGAYKQGQAAIGRGATDALLAQQTPEARASELSKVTAGRAKSLTDSVAAAQTSNSAPLAGKLSPDYQRSQEAAANTVAERTRRAIEQLSKMGAPGEQGLAQGIRFGRAASVVDSSNSAIGNVGNAYMGAIRNTVADPALKLAGSGMMAYGGATAGDTPTAEQPEQLSGPGYEAPTSTNSKVRRAFSIWGRKSN